MGAFPRRPWALLLLAALRPGAALAGPPEAAPPPAAAEARRLLFPEFFAKSPEAIWSPGLSTATKQAVARFRRRAKLPSGLVYGESVRRLDLRGLTARQAEELLLSRGFEKREDWIRDPATREPKLTPEGARMPMHVYLHLDGGMVRVKPSGEPTSRFRPQPNLVKAVRDPPDADHRDFEREAFKVDPAGNPMPKRPQDLHNPYEGTELKTLFLDSWADHVHADLRQQAPRSD